MYSEIEQITPIEKLNEIRIRVNRPISIRDDRKRYCLKEYGNRFLIDEIVGRATGRSLYAYQEEIASGYLFYGSGIRIGVSGKGIVRGEKFDGFKEITSLNIRFPHEILGCSHPLNDIMRAFESTLVVSPPYGGKTTLIRDMARVMSENQDVCIIDERAELYGNGGFTFGPYLDVISNVPKHLAIEGVIRSLSPEIIVLDEISPTKDLEALREVARSGIRFVATAHAQSLEKFSEFYPEVTRLFRYGVALSDKPHVGHIKSIVRFGGD